MHSKHHYDLKYSGFLSFSPCLSAEVSIAEYRGLDGLEPPRQVAVKQLKTQVMTSASDVVDFIEEVRVLHRLSAHRYAVCI
jgi:hypothetical protein